MSCSPMNVSDTNDGQTRVMGWEGHWGWRKDGGWRWGYLSEVLRGPGVSLAQSASPAALSGPAGPSIMTDSKPQGSLMVDRLVPFIVRGGTRTHTVPQP